MGLRHGWLFPLMVVAASAVTAFGCIGIAAIIGYLPLTAPETGNAPSSLESVRTAAEGPAAALPVNLARPATPYPKPAKARE